MAYERTSPPGHGSDPQVDDATGWMEPDTPPRDWKKLLLIIGLGALSWVATYVGMLELIEANMGELPLVHKLIIGFSVAMLMIMVIWLLDQLFSPLPALMKVSYALGYIFLTIISVGFGFGFYWKVLESRSEASRSAESAVGQVQDSLYAASTRLEQLQATLGQLTAISSQKAELERNSGLSCPNSRPGDGPRRQLRDGDAQRFGFASEFVKGRVGAVRAELASLDADLARLGDDKSTIDARSGTRNEFMRGLGRKLDMTVTGFNAFRTDPQLKQIRSDLADRAVRSTFPDSKGGTFACPDPQLQTALHGVVRAIDELPQLEKPRIAAVEGSEATIEAFRRLTATFYGALSFKLPPSADELRTLQQKAVQSVEGGAQAQRAVMTEQPGLSKRDYIPLAIAIFVDLCLLLVSMGRPINRLGGLLPRMRAAERGPVYQILSRFSDIHADAEIRNKFEVFRHVVFDWHGDYYVAVPLDAPLRLNPEQRRALQLEASLLANLFSSFEKDRIFRRAMLPSRVTVRAKLRRQGSKFADAEAFRVYRFTDGAWPEIILGAVMGAARRAEARKRHERAAPPALDAVMPPLESTPADRRDVPWSNTDTPAEAGHSSSADAPYATTVLGYPGGEPAPAESRSPAPSTIDPRHVAKFGRYASFVAAPPARRLDEIRHTASMRAAAKVAAEEAEVSISDAEHEATQAIDQTTHSDPDAASTNVITMPQSRTPARRPDTTRRSPLPTVAEMQAEMATARTFPPAARRSEPQIDITLVERCATVSIPAGQAGVPPAFVGRLAAAAASHGSMTPPASLDRGGGELPRPGDDLVAAPSQHRELASQALLGSTEPHPTDDTGERESRSIAARFAFNGGQA